MTELIIDGYSVALPKDFTTSVKTENPVLTKNGEYSYDITLSLTNKTNQRIFGFLNRINIKHAEMEWSAVMIVNNQVLLNGRAILVSNTESSISLQLISGNSELNFLIGGDKLINTLDLGSVGELTAKEANESLKSHWPLFNYVIAPIYNGGIINSYEVDFNVSEWSITRIIVQPYLGYYIEAIPQALGYTIKENVLRNNRFLSMLYILNISSSREFKDFIPGKTAAEFLTEIEKFLNVVFVVDKIDRSIRILEYAGIHETFGVVTLEASDEYNVYTEEEGVETGSNYQICEYDLPDTTYFKLNSIDKSILKEAEKVSYPDWNTLYDSVKNSLGNYYNKNIIFYSEASESYYLVDIDADSKYYMRRCNLFGKTSQTEEDEDATIKFGIIPAEITVQRIWYRFGGNPYWGYMQYPKSSLDKSESSETEKGILDKIKTGEKTTQSGTSYIECALYCGCYYILNKGGSYVVPSKRYPLSVTDYLLEIEPTKEMIPDIHEDNLKHYTFRLDSKNGRFSNIYSYNSVIDHKKKYEFTFLTTKIEDPRSIFIIRNRSFICQEIEYTITSDGLNYLAKGIFYPYKLKTKGLAEDWILNDGTWNDKGIWSDEEPWNDIDTTLPWTLEDGTWKDMSVFTEDGTWNDELKI